MLHDLYKYKERAIVLLFGLRVSETLLYRFPRLRFAVLFFPSLPQSKANSCVLKRLSSCPAGITQPFIFLLHAGLKPPAFRVFLNLSLYSSLFCPSGLCNHRGEMAPGQLRRYSGNLCRCGSRGGIFLLTSESLTLISYFHSTCSVHLNSVSPVYTGQEALCDAT